MCSNCMTYWVGEVANYFPEYSNNVKVDPYELGVRFISICFLEHFDNNRRINIIFARLQKMGLLSFPSSCANGNAHISPIAN